MFALLSLQLLLQAQDPRLQLDALGGSQSVCCLLAAS